MATIKLHSSADCDYILEQTHSYVIAWFSTVILNVAEVPLVLDRVLWCVVSSSRRGDAYNRTQHRKKHDGRFVEDLGDRTVDGQRARRHCIVASQDML
jgi:hypothetical protein